MATQLTLLTRVAYQEREVAGRQLRQLLAALATDLTSGVSSGRLIETLWPDHRPSHPAKALQVLVSRARSQLGSELIVSTPAGYRLGVPPEEIDVGRAARAVLACERAAASGDHAAALEHAQNGLALWQAPSDGADDGDDPLSMLRADHSDSYEALRRGQALALSRLGRYAEALPLLTPLVAQHPRDEQLLAALLRSEAVTTGVAAALERYEAYRRSLRDRLGSDPGPELQAVQGELLDGGPPRQVRHGIPFEPNSLIGRDDDLAALLHLIGRVRVTSIVGPGGLGKTRLAHLVSHRVDLPRVQFVALAGVSSPEGVLAEVATTLGVRDPRLRHDVQLGATPRDLQSGIVEALSPGPSLLVLDNCEHVVDAVASLVRVLLSLSPDLRVLTTSRAPLGVTSESVYLLPELDLQRSIDLFSERARAARPGVDLPEETVQRLCSHLDGLPLALELAAARTRVMSVAQITDRLGDRFALLRGGARDAPERHRTLQAVIDWSWDLLTPDQQSTLVALSVFPDGFTLEAAETLLGDDAPDLVDRLDALVEQSLLKVEERSRGIRYRMLETVREFGTARLRATGRMEAVRRGFQQWAAGLSAVSIEPLFWADPVQELNRLADEQDNLVTALRTAIDEEDAWCAAATFAALASMWTMRSIHSRTTAYSPDVAYLLSHFRPESEQVEVVRCALTFCVTDVMLGKSSGLRARVSLEQLPKAPPDNPIRALAVLFPYVGRATEDLGASMDELLTSPYPAMVSTAAMMRSHLWENDGLLDRAIEVAHIGFDATSREQTPWLYAMYLSRLGELALQQGDHPSAEGYLQQALPLLSRLGMSPDVQATHWSLSLIALTRGDCGTAKEELDLAERTKDEPGFIPGAFDGLRVRAELDLAEGRIEAGLRRWRRVLERFEAGVGPVHGAAPNGLEPWTVVTEGQGLAAHARCDRVDLVADLPGRLIDKVRDLAGRSGRPGPVPFPVDVPVCGAALLGIGLAQVRGEDPTTGARLVALAQVMQYPRQQPSVSEPWLREFMTAQCGSAYDHAMRSYADLAPEERLPEARRLLDALGQA